MFGKFFSAIKEVTEELQKWAGDIRSVRLRLNQLEVDVEMSAEDGEPTGSNGSHAKSRQKSRA